MVDERSLWIELMRLSRASAEVDVATRALRQVFDRYPQSITVAAWQGVKDGLREMEDWLDAAWVETVERMLIKERSEGVGPL